MYGVRVEVKGGRLQIFKDWNSDNYIEMDGYLNLNGKKQDIWKIMGIRKLMWLS